MLSPTLQRMFIQSFENLCNSYGVKIEGDYERPLRLVEHDRGEKIEPLSENSNLYMWVNKPSQEKK